MNLNLYFLKKKNFLLVLILINEFHFILVKFNQKLLKSHLIQFLFRFNNLNYFHFKIIFRFITNKNHLLHFHNLMFPNFYLNNNYFPSFYSLIQILKVLLITNKNPSNTPYFILTNSFSQIPHFLQKQNSSKSYYLQSNYFS
jgi:hypothetical protein